MLNSLLWFILGGICGAFLGAFIIAIAVMEENDKHE